MEKAKNLGIWMDHSEAHIMEFTSSLITTEVILSEFTHQNKVHSINKSENLMHNKEQQLHAAFYKKISEVIRNYESVILFGPTDAKKELMNLLKSDHHYSKIKIEMSNADKMTENQEHAFVREHFTSH